MKYRDLKYCYCYNDMHMHNNEIRQNAILLVVYKEDDLEEYLDILPHLRMPIIYYIRYSVFILEYE